MGPESSQTSTLVSVIVTVVLVFQTILLLAIAVYLAKISRSVDQLAGDARAFLKAAKRSIEQVDPRIHEISQTVQNQLRHVDYITAELLAKSKTHAVAFDRLIGDFLRTADYANHEIERTARKAFREAHALKAGVRAGLARLFSRRRSDVS